MEPKQIVSELHSDSHNLDHVDPKTSKTNLNGGKLDRSSQVIRKWSELETADSSACVEDNGDGGGEETSDEPSNEIPSLEDKANDREFVACPNQEKGCQWEGRPEELQEHLNKFPGSENPGEVEGCGFQTIECECKESVVFNHKPAHLREHQNHQEVVCEFNYAGCYFRCEHYLMQKHLETNMLEHVQELNAYMKRGKSKVSHLDASHIILHAYCWVFLLIVIILTVALVEYKFKLERFHKDWEREEVNLFMSWATQSSQIRKLQARDGEQFLEWKAQLSKQKQLVDELNRLDSSQNELETQLSEQRRLLNDLKIRVDLLQHDIQKDLTGDMLQVQNKTKNLKTELNSHMRDVEEKILQLQKVQHQAKNTLVDIEFDVKELKTGFSKKYIDNTIRTMMCTLLPKHLSDC